MLPPKRRISSFDLDYRAARAHVLHGMARAVCFV